MAMAISWAAVNLSFSHPLILQQMAGKLWRPLFLGSFSFVKSITPIGLSALNGTVVVDVGHQYQIRPLLLQCYPI
ncbi:hypothetical protein EAO04_17700 [Klebsiella pneumoniae]|uniref:Uncharacterized protein n=1 Tax=Klebsiella pneumoniae TaxID=573 RepID=A0ABD7JJK0_KLEPN|nr:hypothetical protein B5L99_00810 [Klebsiella pneumoniae]ROC03180.1 hypothetical protein C4Z38_028755 [Klebsiella pneumoniae subsp. pneumoniae]OVG09472.1 hypothetical protein B5L92_26420 [Klebsiella pneumoniae]OVJ86974.1 hypothetical protein B8048_22340 [Klebsiella pneumoniae]RRF09017.1 hypothetical protein EAO17_23985 [Klebsiella pneumoniae]